MKNLKKTKIKKKENTENKKDEKIERTNKMFTLCIYLKIKK